jgi:cyclopropane-fatty-acyl-phospholipid synthase
VTATALSPAQALARRAVLRAFEGIERGGLRVEDALGAREFGKPCDEAPATAVLRVRDPRVWPSVALGGSMGGSDAYLRGDWSSPDLTGLLRLFLRNENALGGFDAAVGRAAEWLRRAVHRLRANSRPGSRRNVRAHYDLGNDFFALVLDPTLSYSSGIFERDDATLEEASIAKYERICRKLELGRDDHVLEIGTGWGGFALHAARTRGCRVTTTTLSPAQRDVALERVARAGLGDRVRVLLEDYRALRGRFDKLVSIEMIEAVGHAYFDAYFASCAARLAPHGRMALQAILIAEPFYERARRTVDFIKWHVFPGGCLPSLGAIARSLGRASDLAVVHLEDLTAHYARTLRCWRERLLDNRDAIVGLGRPERLVRTFDFYFAYCEAGFLERRISCAQIVLAKPGCPRACCARSTGSATTCARPTTRPCPPPRRARTSWSWCSCSIRSSWRLRAG